MVTRHHPEDRYWSRLTPADRAILESYARAYTKRGTVGMWWDLAQCIQVALREIDRHRKKARSAR